MLHVGLFGLHINFLLIILDFRNRSCYTNPTIRS